MKCKRILSLALAVCMALGSAALLPEGVFVNQTEITASAVSDGDWEYVVLDDDTISLTKYNGGGGTVTIPSSFEDKDVVSFGTIFKGNRNIAKVIIPDTITSIADNAFNNCTNLSGVTIGSGVKNIGNYAFYNCNALTSIAFPSRLTNIGDYAFFDCYSIKRISFPESVKSIGDYAFARANSYFYMRVEPKSSIGFYHIWNKGWYAGACMSISDVSFEEGLEYIGTKAFYNCFYLKSVSIPRSVISIKGAAFGRTYNTTDGQVLYGSRSWDEPVSGFTFNCYKDSVAHVIAKNYNYNYMLLDVTCVKAKEPTCIEPGNIEYWVYNDDEYYLDNHATNMLTEEQIVVPATGHQWSDWETITKATCTTDGEKLRYCTACGKTEKPKVKKLGHDYSASIVDPTCTKDGYTEHKCSRCSDTYKDNIIPALGHDYVETVVPPTCTAEGYTIHKCSRCGKQYTDTKTDIIEHEPDEAVSENVKPATCLEEGSYDEVIYCKGCHKELSRTKKVIEKIDHSIDDWRSISYNLKKNTITQSGKCTVCGATITRTVENAVTRLSGNNRFGTAAEIAKAAYPTAETVILAFGLNYADALAGVPLAEKLKAPILLTNTKSIPKETTNAIEKLGAKNVMILGGEGAISKDVEDTLKAHGLKTKRLAGQSRFGTATAIAEELNDAPTDVVFVYAFNSADALSVSTVAALKNAPIIYLSTKGELNADTAAYLAKLKEKGCVKNAYVIGGKGVISNDMMNKAAAALGLKKAIRVAGQNRYETCTAVNTKFADLLTGDGICVAKGLDFPDALAGGVYAAATKQALFLADGKKLQDCQNSYLKSKNAGKITVFGGTGAVPDELVKLIAQASV